LVLAGKAHPLDTAGQSLIKEWVQFIKRYGLQHKAAFLSDYDMKLTQQLVQGVDVWINMPRRPWEACGTSGMKVLVNGGLNLSVLDGWWDEAYTPAVGWALGDGSMQGDENAQDARDAQLLYDLLERQVIPEYYQRNEKDMPVAWISRIRESMATLTPRFSASRSMREYTGKYYLPLAGFYRDRSAGKGEKAKQLVQWKNDLNNKWKDLRFGDTTVETADDGHRFSVPVYFPDLRPEEIRVELYANGVNGSKPFLHEMKCTGNNDSGGCIYTATVPADRPSADFTPRIVPSHDSVSIPLENTHILWQR
jgi:starch phosphorylase